MFQVFFKDVQEYQKCYAGGQNSNSMQILYYLSSQVDETKSKKLLHQDGNLFEPLGEKKSAKFKQNKVYFPEFTEHK